MAADHALRERRGAAGVEVADRVAVVDELLGLAVVVGVQVGEGQPVAVGQRLLVLPVRAVGDDDVAHGRHLLDRRRDERDQLRLDDDAARLGMVEHVGDLVRAPAEVHRHADHAELRAGEVGDEELAAVAGRERERVAALVAARDAARARRGSPAR